MSRFHSKTHSKNHHTNSTVGVPDSASDPIASVADPFEGDFSLNGTMIAENIDISGVIADLTVANLAVNNSITSLTVGTLNTTTITGDGSGVTDVDAITLDGAEKTDFVLASTVGQPLGVARLDASTRLDDYNINAQTFGSLALEEFVLTADLDAYDFVTTDELLNFNTTSVVATATYTILSTDRVIICDDDTVGGDITLTLPSAATVGDGWSITIKKDGSTGDIIIDTDGAETIDDSASKTITSSKETIQLTSDGVNYIILYPSRYAGWANYSDTTHTVGSPLVVNNAKVQITIDGLGATTNTDYLPQGIDDFWDTVTNTITPDTIGDAYDVRLDFIADPVQNTDYGTITLDIGGGGTIPIVTRTVSFSNSTAQAISIGFPIFALSTFIANGGKIYFDTSGSGDSISIYDINIFIKRDYSPM